VPCLNSGRLAALLALLSAVGCGDAPCEGKHCPATVVRDAGAPTPSDSGVDPGSDLVQADAACAMQAVAAERGPRRPVDVIFVIDNSGSMIDEIGAVRRNINTDFASIIADSGVDYRVILVSLYGSTSTSICIEPPLAGADCSAGFDATNGQRFFHYDQEIGSNDALCQILDTYDRPDQAKHAPHGFSGWLRQGAAKSFVLITDDSARCSYADDTQQVIIGADGADPFDDALAFHRALLAKGGAQFSGANADYSFFSIVGMARNADNAPIFPDQALVPGTCETAPSAGLSYQALSIITDSLRYPVCGGTSFDAIFQALAKNVIASSQSDCIFQLPSAAPGEELELKQVNLQYQPGDGTAAQHFVQVPDADSCQNSDHSFFITDHIELCPIACNAVTRDPKPEVGILFGCSILPQ
jgi:hypothetical protein